jgi:hypothetical protein
MSGVLVLDRIASHFDDSSTPCYWPPTTPSPPCWPGHDGADDTNTEPANPATNDANTSDLDLRLQY